MATRGQFGAFVPTNFIWDVQQLQQIDVNSPQFKQLIVKLYENLGLMALVLNVKDSGMYQLDEFVNGQLYFPNPANSSATTTNPTNRQVFRKVINFGQLPAVTKSVSHGITCTPATTFTRIYGAASDTTGFNYIPLPYASPGGAADVELLVTATQVTVNTATNRTAFNQTYIVLEYLQS